MKLFLNRLQANDAPWIDEDHVAKLRETAASLNPRAATVDMIIVDDAFIQEINKNYRSIDKPTDVISFSYVSGASDARALEEVDGNVAGEIYVSCETLEKEANAQGVELKHLFLRIGIHGLLHVTGYDHQTQDEAERMEAEEKRLLLAHLNAAEVEALFYT